MLGQLKVWPLTVWLHDDSFLYVWTLKLPYLRKCTRMEAYGIAMIVITSRQTRAIAMNMLKLSILFMRGTHVHFVGRLWKQAIHFGIIRLNTILRSNKILCFCLDLETAIAEKMYKNGGLWYCNDCDYKTPNKSHCYEHVEAKHIVHGGYTCPICGKILKTSGSYRVHQIKSHPQQW